MSLSPPAVLLACAQVLLSRGWCRGSRAQDENGSQCSPLSPRAVAWDLEGALQRAAYFILALPASGQVHAEPIYLQARVALIAHCPVPGLRRSRAWRADALLADYNDAPERTLAEVQAVLEAAVHSFSASDKTGEGSDSSATNLERER